MIVARDDIIVGKSIGGFSKIKIISVATIEKKSSIQEGKPLT